MVSTEYYICGNCNNEFVLGNKRHCPKCNSFNVKPLETLLESVVASAKKNKKNVKENQKNAIVSRQDRGHAPKAILIAWTIMWGIGIYILNNNYDWFIGSLFVAWPFLLIIFLLPVILYQSSTKKD